MSEKKSNYLNEKVWVKLFKDGDKYKDPLFVGINGTNFLIKRGIPVEVPRYVAFAIEDSIRQDTEANEFQLAEERKFLDNQF